MLTARGRIRLAGSAERRAPGGGRRPKLYVVDTTGMGLAVTLAQHLHALGFRQDDVGQYIAEGCRVTLYLGDEYELDIRLPNGSAVGCDVPVAMFSGRTAEEIAKAAGETEDPKADERPWRT